MKHPQLLRILSFFLLLLCLTSCETDPNIETDKEACIAHFLDDFDMRSYNGEELGCKTHIRLYDFENTYFALKINHCADFAPFTIYDCNGEEFCFTSIGPCYIQESVDLGIIGIEK